MQNIPIQEANEADESQRELYTPISSKVQKCEKSQKSAKKCKKSKSPPKGKCRR